ncbi:MAG: potassium channel family protein [bacterium]|nr:potassium channel family protein [bacterium]MDD6225510.1 potassium channel family protein [bacterium]MDY3861815.1 potassium channel family protein [Ruminococcus sp.]
MRKSRIMWNVLKRTGADKLLYGYLVLLLVISFVIVLVEPDINTYFDGLWYCYNVLSTIGLGDTIAVTFVGKVLSIILSVYSILIIAVIPGVITSFYLEVIKLRTNESMEKFLYDLERLPELSEKELGEISEKVKKFNKNRHR